MPARLVIGGTSSGVGKTTVTVALARALRARGLRVVLFKCGPDYLDPTYHARASGAPTHNLDGWMMGREGVLRTFAQSAREADVALVEGVMGLFDGASPASDAGSTAEIAKWLQAPVLLVCDASGMARSIAALGHGFASFDSELRVAGLIANRVGSRGHLDLLRQAAGGPPVLGGFAREPTLAFAERHLGLRAARSDTVSDDVFDEWGRRGDEWLDVDLILEHARAAAAPLPPAQAAAKRGLGGGRCRIGIAFDEAFHFYYEDNLRRLEELGAELVEFSPVRDERLPEVDGLYFGGGYPELHAKALSHNQPLRRQVVAFASAQGPVYAECGGLMYLCSTLLTAEGASHDMVGIIPGEVRMRDRLQALGYVEVETRVGTLLGPPGLRFRGHQFRYSELCLHGEVEYAYTLHRPRRGEAVRGGYRVGSTLASYAHAHWASNPLAAEGFVASCAAYARRQR